MPVTMTDKTFKAVSSSAKNDHSKSLVYGRLHLIANLCILILLGLKVKVVAQFRQ